MVILKVFDADSVNHGTPLSVLQIGKHVLGRGSFINCTDKRISRKHAEITVEDNQVTLTSVHINPCFYISNSSPTVQILSKNVPVTLTDGDKFAFLKENWYRVEISVDKSENHPLDIRSTDTIQLSLNDSMNVSGSETVPSAQKNSTVTILQASSSTQVSDGISPIKRSLEDLNSGGRKKLKTINDNLDELLKNIKRIEQQDFTKTNGESKEQTNGHKDNDNTNDGDEQVEVFHKKDISDSDDDDSDLESNDVTKDVEVVTNIEVQKSESIMSDSEGNSRDKDEEAGSSDAASDVKKEPMVAVKDNNDEDAIETNKEGSHSKVNNVDTRPSTADVNQAETSGATCKEEQGDAGAGSSGSNLGNKLRKQKCWYGSSCFRKKSTHREEFSHPGDPDYDSDQENDDRPDCTYGAQCYRTNNLHRRQFKHPTARPAPKPAPSRLRRRPAGQQNYADGDSENEDENDEPFSADESSSEDDYQEDSQSDVSDSQYFDENEESEEVRIMFKEAKKFLRKNP